MTTHHPRAGGGGEEHMEPTMSEGLARLEALLTQHMTTSQAADRERAKENEALRVQIGVVDSRVQTLTNKQLELESRQARLERSQEQTHGTAAVLFLRGDVGNTTTWTDQSASGATNQVLESGNAGFQVGLDSTAAQPWNGILGEVVVVNRAITGAEQTSYENYVSSYWGI